MSDCVHDDIDSDQSNCKFEVKNDVYPYFSHQAICSVIVKILELVYMTLIPVYLLCTGIRCLSIQDACTRTNVEHISHQDNVIIRDEALGTKMIEMGIWNIRETLKKKYNNIIKNGTHMVYNYI